jgi:hypothetical protein
LSGVAIAAEPDLLKRMFPEGSDGDRMGAMQEPPATVLSPEMTNETAKVIKQLSGPAPARIDGHRILLQHSDGPVNTILHAFPTESGTVCHYWQGNFGSGSCGSSAFQPDDVVSFTPNFFAVDNGWTTFTSITGLATDEVSKVRVHLANGLVEDAIMGRNAFLWYPRPYDNLERYVRSKRPLDLPKPERSEPAFLEVELNDGSVRKVDLAQLGLGSE